MSSNPPNDPGKPSRLTRQLDLLGIEKTPGLAPEKTAKDQRLMDAVGELKPLAFGAERSTAPSSHLRRTSARWLQTSLALAAVVSLLVWLRRNDDDGLRMKGDIGTARAFADIGGVVKPVTPGEPLPGGAKVRVEVSAHADTLAYLGIVASRGALLTSADDVLRSRLAVRAGAKEPFPGALELVGADEGETAVVILCPEPALAGVADAAIRADLTETLTARAPRGSLSRCKVEAIRLR